MNALSMNTRLVIIAAFLLPAMAQAQIFQFDKPASPIDSLKKALFSLHDTLRIDCLNEISNKYILAEKKDSAIFFSNLAYQEAQKINYIHGIAVCFACKAQIVKHFDDDFIQSETFGKASLYWYEKTGNKKGIERLYAYLHYTVFAQSKFDEALAYAKREYAFATQNDNSTWVMDAIKRMYATYRQNGDWEKSFLYAQELYEFASKINDKLWISVGLYHMAQLYNLIEDYPTALTYFRRVLQTDDKETRADRVRWDIDIWFKMEFTEAFSHLGQFDSAWHYYNLFMPLKENELRVYWVSTGECYYLQKDYRHALQNLQLSLAENRRLNDRNQIMRILLDIGSTYLALNYNEEAMLYGREGLTIALQTRARQHIRDGYRIVSEVYDRQHKTDSANFYFRKYITMKDSVSNDQVKAKFAAYNYEQKIALVNKEKQIAAQELRIKQQELEKQAIHKNFLMAAIAGLILLGGIIFRIIMLRRKNEKHRLELAENELQIQKLESDRTKVAFQQQTTELQMQALRAQMNPHFIFNSLNSINRFILKNQRREATEYLTKFSRLIRMILNSSVSATVTLTEDLEALHLYMELESLRFKNKFSYQIQCDPDVEADFIQVPPLLFQPFIENAIWHGLMHKESEGHLSINISQENEMLVCTITDDGIGRKKAAELKSKSASAHESMGMRITADRIAMIQQQKLQTSIQILDLALPDGSAGGTEVIIKIPVEYD